MTGKGKLPVRCPDSNARWQIPSGTSHERDLGPIELAGEGEHSLIRDALGIQKHGQGVPRERAVGKDVTEDERGGHERFRQSYHVPGPAGPAPPKSLSTGLARYTGQSYRKRCEIGVHRFVLECVTCCG
jgi:hypothetical protein